MSTIEDKAKLIADDVASNGSDVSEVVFDPFTISVIVTVISELVKLYLACRKTPTETAESMRNPGIVEKWRLRRVIKQHVDHDEAHDMLAQPLFKSTLKVSATLTDDEVAKMMEETE